MTKSTHTTDVNTATTTVQTVNEAMQVTPEAHVSQVSLAQPGPQNPKGRQEAVNLRKKATHTSEAAADTDETALASTEGTTEALSGSDTLPSISADGGYTSWTVASAEPSSSTPTANDIQPAANNTAPISNANDAANSSGFGGMGLVLGGLALAAVAGSGGGSATPTPTPTPTPDTTPPTLTIASNATATAKGDVTYTFKFSEAVTGFDASKVSVTNGSKGAFTAVSATEFTLVVSPAANSTGTLTVSVANAGVKDSAGNALGNVPDQTQAYDTSVDTTPPALTIASNATGTANGDVTYTFKFSEAVTGFDASKVTVTNASKGAFTAISATEYTLVVSPTANSTGTLTVSVANAGVKDSAGNALGNVPDQTQAYDTVQTTVEGDIFAGPLVAGHQLSITFYDAKGQVLASGVKPSDTGHYKAQLGNYSGVVLAQVIDGGTGADFKDEASKTSKDLTGNLLGAIVVDTAGASQTLNITPLTTVAAQKAGFSADSSNTIHVDSSLSSSKVSDSNTAVAKAFGLTDIVGAVVNTTVNADGSVNSTPNAYGKVLAAISGMDQASGSQEATITQLVNGLTISGSGSSSTATLSSTLTDQVKSGASAAGLSSSDLTLAGSGSDSASAGSDSPPAKDITVNVTFGPETDGGAGTAVTLFKADGTKLGVATYKSPGKYSYTDTSGYAGVLIAQMVDTDATPDYRDEATGQLKNAAGSYLAVGSVSASGASNLNVNPLTTAAAIKLGVIPAVDPTVAEPKPTFAADITSGKTTSKDITSVNQAVAKAFGVVDAKGEGVDIATGDAPQTVIDTDGAAVSGVVNGTDTASAYGRALAVVSQAEKASGLGVSELATKVATALDTSKGELTSTTDAAVTTAVQNAITQGASNAQGSGQISATQAQTVTKAATGAAFILSTDGGEDTYLNADEAHLNLVISGTFVAGQVLKLYSGTAAVDFTVSGSSTTGSVGYTLGGGDVAASSVTLTVAKSALSGTDAGVILKATVHDATVGDSNSNNLPVVVDGTASTITSEAVAAIDENVPANTVVYTAIATDAAITGQSVGVLYSLKADTGDVAALNIDATTGAVTLKASPDYESKHSYSFTVVATDNAGNTAEKAVTLSIKDLNDMAPVFTSGPTGTVDENAATSTVVYTAATTDADGTAANQAVVYSLKAGTGDVAAFNIDSATGAVTLKASADYETKQSYSFTVVATNAVVGGATKTTEQAVTVSVKDLNDVAPVFTSAATGSVAENAPTNTVVYTATSTDADGTAANQAVVYSLKADTGDVAAFNIDSATGAVTLKASADFETKSSYNFTVVATNAVVGGATQTTEMAVTLNVTNVNEAPTPVGTIASQTAVVNQNVWSLDLSKYFKDVDAGDTLTYTLTSGTLPAGLTLTNGIISGTPSSGTTSTLSLTVQAQDKGGLNTTQTFGLDVVTAPVVKSFTVSDSVASSPNTAQVGKSGEALSFVVTLSEPVTTTGTLTAVFTVNGVDVSTTAAAVTGQSTITFTGANVPDTGNGTTISLKSLTGAATISGDTSHQDFMAPTAGAISYAGYTVDNTAPNVTSTSFSVAENATAFTGSGALAADEAVTWSLGTGADTALFALGGASGNVLSLLTNKNYEVDATSTHSYTVNVVATDAVGHQTNKAITVNLTDVNEAPTTVGTIAAQHAVTGQAYNFDTHTYFNDVDAGNNGTLHYSISGAHADFKIDSTTGVITGTHTGELANQTVTVTATDGGNLSVAQTFDMNVITAPALLTTLSSSAVKNLDVTSNLVLNVGETVTAVAGKKITLTDLGGTHYHGENVDNSYTLTFKADGTTDIAHGNDAIVNSSTAVKIVGTGANTHIVIDLPHDLDFASNYSLAVDTGAFLGTTSQQNSVAFTTVQFSTVVPDASKTLTSTAGASQSMSDSGALQTSYTWLDMADWGNKTGGTTQLDLSAVPGNKLAFVSPDYLAQEASEDGSISGLAVYNINLTMTGFGANNLIYFDDLGRNEVDAIPNFDGIGITPTLDPGGVNMNIDSSKNEKGVDGDGGNLDFVYTGAALAAIQAANAGEMITQNIWQKALNSTHAPVIYG
jgi:hypothetical protein